MLEHTTLDVSGDRFTVVYAIFESKQSATDTAQKICVEQTIEFPPQLVQDDDIRGHVFGRVEEFCSVTHEHHEATISYAIETTAFNFPQFLNVVYGNVSLFPQVKVQTLVLPDSLAEIFKGPRFGARGLRELFKRPGGPVFMSAIKPQGLSAKALADQAMQCALGGLDVVKDDHGLSNQPFAPFRERVALCAQAVQRANQETGGNCLYAPMLSSPNEQIWEDALFAKEQGAGALLIAPALIGFDLARRLAESDDIGLPMIGHPAMLGSYVVSATNGYSHYAMFGQIMRLMGMDASIFPNYGGRFSFSADQCKSIVSGCSESFNHFESILPSPGGGMTFENVPDMVSFYGDDVMYLMGGSLHTQGLPLAESCRQLRQIATRWRGDDG